MANCGGCVITSVADGGGGGGRSDARTSTASSSVNTSPDSWPDPARSGPTVERDAGGSGGASRVSGGTPSLAAQIGQPALQLRLSDRPERDAHDLLDVDQHLLRLLVAGVGASSPSPCGSPDRARG